MKQLICRGWDEKSHKVYILDPVSGLCPTCLDKLEDVEFEYPDIIRFFATPSFKGEYADGERLMIINIPKPKQIDINPKKKYLVILK